MCKIIGNIHNSHNFFLQQKYTIQLGLRSTTPNFNTISHIRIDVSVIQIKQCTLTQELSGFIHYSYAFRNCIFTCVIWLIQFNLRSIITPRYFALSTLINSLLSITTLLLTFCFILDR